jgi:phenylpyruvate tautomerase
MPLLKLQLSVTINEDKKRSLLTALSKIVSETLGKPESYVMITIEQCSIFMSGTEGPAAFADIKSIGAINNKNNSALSQKLCTFLTEQLSIPTDRIFLNFTDIPAANWGWNSSTFG